MRCAFKLSIRLKEIRYSELATLVGEVSTARKIMGSPLTKRGDKKGD